MLAKPHQLFQDAIRADYAVGAFNTSNMEVAQSIVRGAVVQKAPVIVQTSEGAIEYAGLNMIASIIKALADDVEVPVVLHLDHGRSLDMVKQCIEVGYTSVMIDASKDNLEDNIMHTKEVVNYAHQHGVWAEAELGAIIGKEGIKGLHGATTPESYLTDPGQVEQFVGETDVDALAVSVGTVHGAFTGQEYIRFELLQKIQDILPSVPLVLHGASGIADKHLRRATAMRVCKVNVDTELRIVFEDAVRAYLSEKNDDVDPRKMLGPARSAVQRVVEHKIKLFGSAGMAKVY